MRARRALLAALLGSVLALVAAAGLFLDAHAAFDRPRPDAAAASPAGPGLRAARLPDPGAPLRLVVLGTSLTARGTWPEELAAALRACRPGPVLLRRVAKAGAASDWGRAAAARALAASPWKNDVPAPPDLMLVEFAINDASLARGPALSASVANMAAILDQAAATGGTSVALLTMNPAWGRERLERPGFAAYVEAHVALARARGAGVIDTLAAWRSLPEARRRSFAPDDLHPTEDGMRAILLPALAGALNPSLCAVASN